MYKRQILNLVETGSGISILPVRLVREQLARGIVHILETPSKLPMQDVFIGTNKGAVVRALPQVTQMIRKVSSDVAFCG